MTAAVLNYPRGPVLPRLSTLQIVYGWEGSPFFRKLQLVLLFKRIPHHVVLVSWTPPRPELLQLGITYRRAPVLAIGSDLYLDTSLAVQALEARFPQHPLLSEHRGLQEALAFQLADRALVQLAVGLFPMDTLPAEFVRDRVGFLGAEPATDPAVIEARRSAALSSLRSHLQWVEGQLASQATQSRAAPATLLGTKGTSYLDLSLFTVLDWISTMPAAAANLGPNASEFPLVRAWLATMGVAVACEQENHHKLARTIGGDEAAAHLLEATATASPCECQVDECEPLLQAGYLKVGQKVAVTPTDMGKVPQHGSLVGINSRAMVLKVEAGSGVVFVHAPRLGFEVVAA